MLELVRRRWATIAGVLGVVTLASPAHAQFFPGNNPYFRPTGGVNVGVPAAMVQPQPAVAPIAPPPLPPILPGGGNLITNQYGSLLPSPIPPLPFPPFSPFYFNPGASLSGSADVINAQGRYLIDRQDALMKRESVKQMKLETRRKIFDEWLYERERTPRPEELRQQAIREQLTRSLSNPPANEITAGISLNHILAALESMDLQKAKVQDIPLDEDLLKQINVTKGSGTGNAGVVRNEGKLNWPRALETLNPVEKTTELRKKIEARTRAAYDQAAAGKVENDLIRELQTLSAELNGILTRSINSMGFQDFTESKKFMKSLDDSITVLARGDARDFLDGANVAKGKTVQDLVMNMSTKGLRFAPAVGNSEAAYMALHRALVQYHNAMTAELTKDK